MKESEIAVLGSILADPSVFPEVAVILSREHFSAPAHGAIYETIRKMRTDGKPIDPVMVMAEMGEELDPVGGRKYIFDLVNQVPSSLHAVHYAAQVRDSWRFRRVKELAEMLSHNPDDLNVKKRILDAFNDTSASGSRTIGMAEAINEYNAEIDNRILGKDKTWKTGFQSLDNMCAGGFRKGQLVTIGARTSRGKSALLLKLAITSARQGASVLFCSQEMTVPEIMDRAVAMNSNVSVGQARRAERAILPEINSALGKISGLKIRWGNQKNFNLDAFAVDVERERPDILIVDYIQRIPAPATGNRAAHYSDVANRLKSIALQNGTVIITASQLGRAVELRDDHTPTLADLKESGGIEEASDVVVLVHTPEEDILNGVRRGSFIVAKNRNGATASMPVVFRMGKTEFVEEEQKSEAFV